MIETLIGFLGGMIADIVRGIFRDLAASRRAETLGAAKAERDALAARLEQSRKADEVDAAIDGENDMGKIIDRL